MRTIEDSLSGGDGRAAAVLARVAGHRRAAQAAEAAELQDVVAWADLHRLESPVDRSSVGPHGSEGVLLLAGSGSRGVAEFAVCELAATLAMSETKARRYLGEALELRDRLPRLYAKAIDAVLPVWRARQVAEQTVPLSAEVAAFVDAHLSGFAEKLSASRVRRCVEAAVLHCDPDTAKARAEAAAEERGVWFADHLEGVSRLQAVLDTPGAVALDDRVAVVAAWLTFLGDTDPLDVRRAKALGLLADPQAALEFEAQCLAEVQARRPGALDAEQPGAVMSGSVQRPGAGHFGARWTLHLHVHTTAEAVLGPGLGPVVRVEGPGRRFPVPLAAVQRWLGDLAPGVSVKVTPVIDLAERISSDAYEAPPRLAAQVDERDLVCVFPWCGHRGRYDLDHVDEYVFPDRGGPPGQTNSRNMGRVCRFHHRVKTHTAWNYWREPDGSLTWESPTGQRYRVDHTGTTRLR